METERVRGEGRRSKVGGRRAAGRRGRNGSTESGLAAPVQPRSVFIVPMRDGPLPVGALVGELQVVLPGAASCDIVPRASSRLPSAATVNTMRWANPASSRCQDTSPSATSTV